MTATDQPSVAPPAEFPWSPHRYRDIKTGQMATDPTIEHADNGRSTKPGHLRVSIAPYMDGFNLIIDAPSWLKPYYTRAWDDREQARTVAHRLLAQSLNADSDLPRRDLHKVIERLAEATS